MKKLLNPTFDKALLFGLIFSVLLSFSRFDASCEDLRSNILRLHIIANSDSKSDQNLKLKVRDAVLNNTSSLFIGSKGLDDSICIAQKNIDKINSIANDTLKKSGVNYTAKSKIGKSYYKTRYYKTFTLPAGYYDSLIITLGTGKGHNWWCVIYPEICLNGASKQNLNVSCSDKSSRIAYNSKKYTIRFKTVEIYENIKKRIKNYSSSKAPV